MFLVTIAEAKIHIDLCPNKSSGGAGTAISELDGLLARQQAIARFPYGISIGCWDSLFLADSIPKRDIGIASLVIEWSVDIYGEGDFAPAQRSIKSVENSYMPIRQHGRLTY
jgi:hypothetical protein